MMDYRELGSKLHRESIVIDGLSFLYVGPSPRLNPELVTATNVTVAETYHDYAEAVTEAGKIRTIAAADPQALLIETAADIRTAKAEGKYGIMMGWQATLPLETDLDRVDVFHHLGLRVIQLTYNDRTYAGDGCLEPIDGGLSLFGKSLVKKLGQAGIVMDLSHVGRRTMLEAVAAAEVPPVVTHTMPLAITDNPRNVTDEQIRAVADAGGVVGCCCWAPIAWKNRDGVVPTVDDYVDHIDYVVELVGIDHVSIATDSACTEDSVLLNKHSAEFNTAFPEIATPYYQRVSDKPEHKFPEGVPGIADLTAVTGALVQRGYKAEDVQKIVGLNLLRVFEQVWK